MTEAVKVGRKALSEDEKTVAVTFYTKGLNVRKKGGMVKARAAAKKLFEESAQPKPSKSK